MLSIFFGHTQVCVKQPCRKRNLWTPNHFVPLIKSHFSPVKASTPNTSSVSDPDLTSLIKTQITKKNINSNNDSNFTIPQSSDEIATCKANEPEEKNSNADFDSLTMPLVCLQVVHQTMASA